MPPKPTNQEVLDAVQSLSVGMGAELVALRAEVEKLSLTITGLSHMMANAATAKESQMPSQSAYTPPVKQVHQYTQDQIYNAEMPLNSKEQDYVKGGHLIDAIKEYRGRIKGLTGEMPGLKAAKDLVEAFKANLPNKPAFDILNPPPLLPLHKALVKDHKKIDAIKEYRAYTMKVCSGYAGLKEAKDILDAYAFSIGASNFYPSIEFETQPW